MAGISKLDHVNIRTNHLPEMIAWYTDILGFEQGPRPNFPFGGAWMYRGDAALVHLVSVEEEIGEQGDLTMEHVAFSSTGLEGFLASLTEKGVEYRIGKLDDFGITQVNIWDPDGNHLHIDFLKANGD